MMGTNLIKLVLNADVQLLVFVIIALRNNDLQRLK
jgi:hypothetical protein